jgi:hypothetical protein
MQGAEVQGAARLRLTAASVLAVPIKRLDRNPGITKSSWEAAL